MAKKAANKATLASLLGEEAIAAHEEHKADQTVYDSGGEIPPGVEGVCKVIEVKWDKHADGNNKGKPYFTMTGIAQSPQTAVDPRTENEVKVVGKRVSIFEPLYDTPTRSRKTTADHIAFIYNELRKLGIDTQKIKPAQWDAVFDGLSKAGKYSNFRSWIGQATEAYPNPSVNFNFTGLAEDFEPDDRSDEEQDESEEEETEEPETEETEEEESEEEEAEEDAEEESEEEEDSKEDPTALGEAADGGDEEAVARLTELASASGIDPDQYETWAEVSALLQGSEEEEESEEEEAEEEADEESDDEDWEPQKDEIYLFKPKGKRKAIEVQVTAVFAGKQTCNVKSLKPVDGSVKTYKGVSWDRLEGEE